MYKQVETDKEFEDKGNGKHTPVATLVDEYGGRAQIGTDDHCFVLYQMNSDTGKYNSVKHWFTEAAAAMKTLGTPREEEAKQEQK